MRSFFAPAVRLALLALAGLSPPLRGEILLRWNQAGYQPERPKVLVAMSTRDLQGRAWRIERVTEPTAGGEVRGAASSTPAEGPTGSDVRPVLSGEFGASIVGIGDHTPWRFNHALDFSALVEPGSYRCVVEGAAPAVLRIERDPYAVLVPQALRHLRVMRSGSPDTLVRRTSHLGDARAPVFEPVGNPADGAWRAARPRRTVDALGGWYDAGDQIKFTLTIAYTTYHLLHAWRLAPERFPKSLSRTPLPDVLDEAQHGLEFLARTHPDRDTFIIQVGNAEDHNQRRRLPEDDALDGHRPALCALSRAHLGSAAAALALGARVFRELGRDADAGRYAAQAIAIEARAREPDTIETAFERDSVNDFYRDPGATDQLALAAAELFALTGDRAYLERAIALAPPAGAEVSWGEWNWLANLALAPHDTGARARLAAEAGGYRHHAAQAGAPWGVPGGYVWGSLHRWIGDANAVHSAALLDPGAAAAGDASDPDADAVFWGMLDYIFGRNNWGVSFLFSRRLPNSVQQIYSPVYQLLGVFPTGALSEGPGNRRTHDSLEEHFGPPGGGGPLRRFNTRTAVFADDARDFMCQEATIGGQADLVLMLTLAALPPR